jgi:hypothetical protein
MLLILFSISLQAAAWTGAELFLELVELDFRDKDDWLRDLGLSDAIAAISEMATGQNHSWLSQWCRWCGTPWITTAKGVAKKRVSCSQPG